MVITTISYQYKYRAHCIVWPRSSIRNSPMATLPSPLKSNTDYTENCSFEHRKLEAVFQAVDGRLMRKYGHLSSVKLAAVRIPSNHDQKIEASGVFCNAKGKMTNGQNAASWKHRHEMISQRVRENIMIPLFLPCFRSSYLLHSYTMFNARPYDGNRLLRFIQRCTPIRHGFNPVSA